MPQEDLTDRERLALDLERVTDKLRDLVDKYAPTVDTAEAPSGKELGQLGKLIDKMDDWGGQMAPWLYQPRATHEALHAAYIDPAAGDEPDPRSGRRR